MEREQISKVIDCALAFSKKLTNIKVSEWAEQNRILTKKVTSKPGPFRYDNVPYSREIADRFSKNDPTREIAVMKSAQAAITGGVFESAIGCSIDNDPGPIMYVTGDLKLLKEFKDIRINNLIDNSGLRKKIVAETANKNSRKQGDTAEKIDFIGGFIRFVGANNATALRMFSIEKLFLDELDSYPKELKPDGNPIDLAVSRTIFYAKSRKIGYVSTPTLAHSSNIFEYYKKGDQRKYQVPCPFCGCFQEFEFYSPNNGEYPDNKGVIKEGVLFKPYGLVFDKDECHSGDFKSVNYKCKHCGELIPEYRKDEMMIKGFWSPTAKSKKPNFVSYHINALMSPAYSWKDIVADFLDCGKDPTKLRVFYNNVLGLPFEDMTSGVNAISITKLRDGKYENDEMPEEALFLTAACDVQDDRLEVEIKAWGDRFRNWGINHIVIQGEISNPLDDCWKQLADLKDKIWAGKQIFYMLVDSGDGEKTDLIYRFCEQYGEGVIFPSKGISSTARTKDKYKIKSLDEYSVKLVEIYVDEYKNQLALWFNQEWRESDENYPDGWTTIANGYSDEYLRQLTTEKRVKKVSETGFTNISWVEHGRNEAFDLNVYNLCAADLVISEISRNYLKLPTSNASAVFETLKAV